MFATISYTNRLLRLIATFSILALCLSLQAAEPPVIPIGEDAYLQWDHWPYQRIGTRAYMRSTYDRRGGNEGADASHFLYQLADDNNVTLDVEGRGILYFARYNHWHGSPWRYVVDGTEHLIEESSTADPKHPSPDSVFIPKSLFPPPLATTWSATKGADLSWVPIPFENSFRMGYSRTRYGTGYYIYHLYAPGTKLSGPIHTWDGTKPPSPALLELINRAGTDISPSDATESHGSFNLVRGENSIFLNLSNAPATLRKLSFSVSKEQAIRFGGARLRITWDDRPQASVDAPVALFFGAGTLYNRDNREYLVRAFPSFIRSDHDRVELACFFPMPFFKSARLELVASGNDSITNVLWSVKRESFRDSASQAGYFHATFRDFTRPERGQDLVLLDTREVEGGGDWSGSFIGNSWIFSTNANLGTLEGDPRFFFDDSQTPQAYGTGTEEWGGGGDYWGGRNMTLPFAGHPVGARNIAEAKNDEDKIQSAYRFLLADLMPFGKNAVIRLEHGGQNESTEHYQAVTYWYGAPAASLVKTDELKVGDPASEQAHRYASPDASEPYEITSRYEWGVDTLAPNKTVIAGSAKTSVASDPSISKEKPGSLIIYPEQTDHGRTTKGTTQFRLKIKGENLGVLLRRKLDYSFPNQRAEVFVADGANEDSKQKWERAGIWYLAGSNTCIYSNPPDELGATEHIVQTSNRRFRDDEFLLPLKLTKGRSSIYVKITFIPVMTPLFPGYPLASLAWSEIRYDAYCFVMPEWGSK
jgi:hypothetical protein